MAELKIRPVAVRANAGMSMDEWAKALGVDRSTVNNWEKGVSEPRMSVVRKMEELSGIPMQYIFFGPQSNENVLN